MSLINVREKTIQAKIVYYGTALSGKTTSLKHVHRVIDPEGRVELVSLNTEGDRTFFFDFLPIPLGAVHGYQLKFQAFTVPGQVKYNLTRRFVLRGADAVIFVADSSPEAHHDNLISLISLVENLQANGLDTKTVPVLFQYNKRDVANALAVERLRSELNPEKKPDAETIATTGVGAFEAFSTLCGMTVEKLTREYRVGDPAEARQSVEKRLRATQATWDGLQAARKALPADKTSGTVDVGKKERTGTVSVNVTPQPLAVSAAAAAAGSSLETDADVHTTAAVVQVSSADVPDLPNAEQLLQHAVDSNIESARLVSELTETRRRLSDHNRQLAALHQTGVVLSSELNPETVLEQVMSAALRTVDSAYGSVLFLDDTGAVLIPKYVHGLTRDPIVKSSATNADFLARVRERKPFVVDVEPNTEVSELSQGTGTVPSTALVAPLVHRGLVLGLLVAYVVDRPFESELKLRLKFLGAIASQASVAIVNSRLIARFEAFNRELERKVQERTGELKTALEELRQIDRLKDDFLASMSHELLTPLQSIGSSAEILSVVAADEGARAAEERREFSNVVLRESARLTTMLQSVLDMGQLEAGKVAMERGGVPLKEALLESYQRLRNLFKSAHARLKVRVEEKIPPAAGDARWLGRVFDAVLSNAVKFGPVGSDVIVTVRRDEDCARIEVRDNGPGVPEAQRGQIFLKFKQVGEVLTDKPPGLGLGLPMSREILKRMGGRIWHEPAPTGGSVFVVMVPFAGEASDKARAGPADEPAAAPERVEPMPSVASLALSAPDLIVAAVVAAGVVDEPPVAQSVEPAKAAESAKSGSGAGS